MSYPIAQDNTTITLYLNVPFSNSYEDHPYCLGYPLKTSNFLELKVAGTHAGQYYDAFKHLVISSNYNFSYENQLNTSVEINLETENELVFTDANYLKVHTQNKDYYYFVIGTKQKRNNLFRFELELDVIMTYGHEIKQCLYDKPLLTDRKMCYRFAPIKNGTTYYLCRDLVKKEEILNNIKPNKVVDVYKQNIQETYLAFQFSNTSDTSKSTIINALKLPFITKICPARYSLTIKDNLLPSKNNIYIESKYDKYYNDNNIVAVKALSNLSLIDKIKSISFNDLTHDASNKKFTYYKTNQNGAKVLDIVITYNKVDVTHMVDYDITNYSDCELIINEVIVDADENSYKIQDNINVDINTPTTRSINYEPKLWCFPARDYKLKTAYSDGISLMSNIMLSLPRDSGETIVKLKTYTTPYAGDTSVYTTYDFNISGNLTSPFQNGVYSKNGIGGTPNYSLPTARNALEYFNQTNSSSFFTGKVFGAIAGIAKNPTPVGSTISVASATADIIATYEDLSNTPESVSSFGTNFVADLTKNNISPYIVEYVANDEVLNQLMDYFYNFGYVVNKECYFKSDNNFINNGINEDNMLFTRRIFNYIKLKENIISKLNVATNKNGVTYTMPHIVKEKINEIFNKGIKLWNFDGFNFWYIGNPSYDEISNYYLKSTLENWEI